MTTLSSSLIKQVNFAISTVIIILLVVGGGLYFFEKEETNVELTISHYHLLSIATSAEIKTSLFHINELILNPDDLILRTSDFNSTLYLVREKISALKNIQGGFKFPEFAFILDAIDKRIKSLSTPIDADNFASDSYRNTISALILDLEKFDRLHFVVSNQLKEYILGLKSKVYPALLVLLAIFVLAGGLFVRRSLYLVRKIIVGMDEVQEKTRISEEQLRNITDNTSSLIFLKNFQGKYLFINKQFEKIFQMSRKQILGKSDHELFSKKRADEFVVNDQKVLESISTVEFEEHVDLSDGMRTYIVVKFPLLDSNRNPYALGGIATDITERKEFEEELERHRFELARAQTIAHLGSWVWDVQLNKLSWSDEVYRIFGLTPREFCATYEAFLDCVHPDDRELVDSSARESFENKKLYNIEHRIIRPDGEERIVHEQSENFYDEDGRPLKMIGTVLDITERKRAEKELEFSREGLRDLNKKLQSVREEEKLHLAREIHDELGQVITYCKLDLLWIKKEIKNPGEKIYEKLDTVVSHLDDSLRSVRRISSDLRPEILDILGISEAIKWQIQKFKDQTNIEYELDILPEKFDCAQEMSIDLFRIFQETLTNISRHAQATSVQVTFVKEKKCFRLIVKDNGKGFDVTFLEPFRSLGILGMKERALNWGGQIDISSRPHVGTIVTVSIPITDSHDLNSS
jgi:PAS domain S-box-containing protein